MSDTLVQLNPSATQSGNINITGDLTATTLIGTLNPNQLSASANLPTGVFATGVASGNVPQWNGTAWVWTSVAASGMANPMTATGDIIYGTTTASPSVPGTLAIGAAGTVLTSVNGLPAWQAPASGFADPETTTGDMIYRASTGTTRLPIGTSVNDVLTATGGIPTWGLLTNANLSGTAGITAANLAVSAPTAAQLGGLTTSNLSATAGIVAGQIASINLSAIPTTGTTAGYVLTASTVGSAPTWAAAAAASGGASLTAANTFSGEPQIFSAAAPAVATNAIVNIGNGGFAGATGGFNAQAGTNGTLLGMNTASGFTGNFLDLQVNGSNMFTLSANGVFTALNGIVTGSTYTYNGGVPLAGAPAWKMSGGNWNSTVFPNQAWLGILTGSTYTNTAAPNLNWILDFRQEAATSPASTLSTQLFGIDANGDVYAKGTFYSNGTAVGGSGGMTNPMTTANDIIIGGASGAPARLATANSSYLQTSATGVISWGAAPSGSGGLASTTSTSIASVAQGTAYDYAWTPATNPYLAIKFTAGSTATMGAVQLPMKKDANTADTAEPYVYLYSDNAGSPGTQLAGYTADQFASQLSVNGNAGQGYTNLEWGLNYNLTSGTAYWIVLSSVYGGSGTIGSSTGTNPTLYINENTNAGTSLIATSSDASTWTLVSGATLAYAVLTENSTPSNTASSDTGTALNLTSVVGIPLTASSSQNTAVQGTSDGYYGLFGKSTNNAGVFGQSTTNSGISGLSGSGLGGYFESQQGSGLSAWQRGALTATTAAAAGQVIRALGLGSYDATGPTFLINDSTAASGKLLSAQVGGSFAAGAVAPTGATELFSISKTGSMISSETAANTNPLLSFIGNSTSNNVAISSQLNIEFPLIATPTGTLSITVSGNGGGLAAGYYWYAVSFVTQNNGETSLGAFTQSPTSTGLSWYDIGSIPVGPGNTMARCLYRSTTVNPGTTQYTTYEKIATINDNTTTYYTDQANAGSGSYDYTTATQETYQNQQSTAGGTITLSSLPQPSGTVASILGGIPLNGGNGNGTFIGFNSPVYWGGDFINFQMYTGPRFRVDNNGNVTAGGGLNINPTTATTVGAAGTAAALPTAPVGYIEIQINGTTYKVPYYNV